MGMRSENEERALGLLSEINNLSNIGMFLENVIDDLFKDFKKKFKEKVVLLIEQLEQSKHVEEKKRKKYESKNEIENKQRKIEQTNSNANNPLNDSVLDVYIKQVTHHNKNSLIKQLQSDLNEEEIDQLFEKTKEENEKIIFFNSTKDIDLEKMFPTIAQVSKESCPIEKECKENKKEVFKTIRKSNCLYSAEQKERGEMKTEAEGTTNKWEIRKGINNGLIEKKFNFNERIIEPIKLKKGKDSKVDAKKNEKIEEKKETVAKYSRRLPPFTAKNDETHITDYFSNKKRNVDSQLDINKNSYIYKYCTSSGIKKSDTSRKQEGEEEHLPFKICDVEKEKKEGKMTERGRNKNLYQDMVAEEKQIINGFLSCDSDEINYEKLKLEKVCEKEKNSKIDEKYAQRNKTDSLLKDNYVFSKEEKMKNTPEYITKQKVETNDIYPKPEMSEIENIKTQHHTHQHEQQHEYQHQKKGKGKGKDTNLFYEVVRGKERKNLKGFDCAECKLFYEEFLSECSEEEKKVGRNKRKGEHEEQNRTDNNELKKGKKRPKDGFIEDKNEIRNFSFFEDVARNNIKNNGTSKNENIDRSASKITEEVNIMSERNMSQISFDERDYCSVDLRKGQKHDIYKTEKKTEMECEVEKNNTSNNDKKQKKKQMIQSFSRHRYHNKVNDSPTGFWGFDFFK